MSFVVEGDHKPRKHQAPHSKLRDDNVPKSLERNSEYDEVSPMAPVRHAANSSSTHSGAGEEESKLNVSVICVDAHARARVDVHTVVIFK